MEASPLSYLYEHEKWQIENLNIDRIFHHNSVYGLPIPDP